MSRLIALFCLSGCLLWSPRLAPGQDPKPAPAPAPPPKPVTTADPQVTVDVLALLLKPLTKEDLIVEANGWRDLLKAKVGEVSAAEIAVKQQNKKITAAQQEVAKAKHEHAQEEAEKKTAEKHHAKSGDEPAKEPEAKQSEPKAPAPEDKQSATQADEVKAEADKDKLLASLPKLRDEKTALSDRLNAVLLELEAKGGDPAPYRKYIAAISGLQVDVHDAKSAWTSIVGWATSTEGGIRWAWNIARFVCILIGFYVLAVILSGVAERATLAVKQMSGLLRAFITNSVFRVVMGLGFIVALAALEVNIGPMLAAVGAVGFVVGFALQDTLGNFAAGVMILAYRPFDVGDHVDVAGVSGTVTSMNLVSTQLKTTDGKDSIIPNNKIWGGIIAKGAPPAKDAKAS